MTTDYKLRINNTSGALQAELADFRSLNYVKETNRPGLLQFSLRDDHEAVTYLTDKAQVEVWRRNRQEEIDWYCDFYGLFRQPKRTKPTKIGIFAATCPGQLSMLAWRIVAWKSGIANRSKFTAAKAETVMKTLVSYNAGASATTGNGRIRTGTITGLSVQADGANGNTLDFYCPFKNLLETLQELARIGGGDFDLVKTGAATWEFRWYTGQVGADRTASVIFSTDFDNMAVPEFEQNRLGEKTVAIVGGQNEGTDRDVVVRTGANYGASNDIEVFVDAREVDAGNTAGLNAKGDDELKLLQATDEFDFDVLQVPSTLYGKHYFLGDLVTVRSPFTGANVSRKIISAAVDVTGNREKIGVKTQDIQQ